MREIKFRGRVPDKGWLYGDLRHIGNNLIYIVDKFGHGSSVNPNTVGQFTGLEDCEGREIYEGDIVRFTEAYTGVLGDELVHDVVGVVRYVYCEFKIVSHGVSELWAPSLMEGVRVIGNVHDNPELLRLTKTGGFEK